MKRTTLLTSAAAFALLTAAPAAILAGPAVAQSNPPTRAERGQDMRSQNMRGPETQRRQDQMSQGRAGESRMMGQDRGRLDQMSPGRTIGQDRTGQGSPSAPQTKVSVDVLKDRLASDGEFVRIERLGEVWKPRGVERDWQPYVNGRWIFNDRVGWYFESGEPWAEVAYHYGRWHHDPDHGWVWSPGTEWAPAWVEWRRSGQHIGWRPLPPENAPRRTARTGQRRGGSSTTVIEEEEWVFVPTTEITSERIVEVRERPERVTEIWRSTQPVGRVERRGEITVNFGVRPDVIQREHRDVRIESRNLPRSEAVPVPQAIREISTESRTTATTTTGAPRTGGDAERTGEAPRTPASAGQERTGAAPSGSPSTGAATAPSGTTEGQRTGQGDDRTRPSTERPSGAAESGGAGQPKPGEATGTTSRTGQGDDRTRPPTDRAPSGSAERTGGDQSRPGAAPPPRRATEGDRARPGGSPSVTTGEGQRRDPSAAAQSDRPRETSPTGDRRTTDQPRPRPQGADRNPSGQDRMGQERGSGDRPASADTNQRRPSDETTGATLPRGSGGGSGNGTGRSGVGGGSDSGEGAGAPTPRLPANRGGGQPKSD